MPYEITEKERDRSVRMAESRNRILKAIEENDDLSLSEWVAVFIGLANRLMMDAIKEEEHEPPWIPGNRPEKDGFYQISTCNYGISNVLIDNFFGGKWMHYWHLYVLAYKEIVLSEPYREEK